MLMGNSFFRHATADPARMPWFLPLLTITAYLLLKGYSYGDGDHDDFLPYLLHLLDSRTLASDWYVSLQMEGIGPRTGFVWMMFLPSKLFGPSIAFAVLYVASWCAIASAIYALSYHITPDRIVAAGTLVAVLIFTPKYTLGSNDIVHSQLTPSMASWALAIWGIVMHVRKKPLWAALFLGLATTVQALVGMHMALVFGLMMLWERRPLRSILVYAITFLLVSLPSIGPQIVQQWNTSASEPSLFHILFEFRAPHHYIPSRFVLISAVGFLGLLMAAVLCSFALPPRQRTFPLRALIIIGALCLVGYVGTEIFRSELVGKLQLFRTTVFAKIALLILICSAIGRFLPAPLRSMLTPLFDHSRATIAITALVAIAVCVLSPDALGFKPASVTDPSSPQERIMQWARTETARESVFAVPPSWESFRSRARRGIIVSFKAVPFTTAQNLEWYHRLQAVAPVETATRQHMPALIRGLDHAFFGLSSEHMWHICQRYGASHTIRQRSAHAVPEGFESVFVAGDLVVYKVVSR